MLWVLKSTVSMTKMLKLMGKKIFTIQGRRRLFESGTAIERR